MDPLSLSLSFSPLSNEIRGLTTLSTARCGFQTPIRVHHSFFLFPSYISFSFCVRFHPPFSFPPFLPPPSPKRGLHAFALRGHRSLLTRDRTHHATFSSAFLAEWSIFRERGGKEGDGAYNWVQLGPAGACSASKDSSLPPSPPSRASRRRKFELRNNATVTRDPLSKGVF